MTAKQPAISLVALVRDEASDLRHLLTWHRPLYDEAIVVDTGSRDDSVAVGQELGAQVTHFTWCDDFSAARNFGLARAHHPWVLVLDCDETISPVHFAAIRSLLDSSQNAWIFQQRNYCGNLDDPQWVPVTGDEPLAPPAATGYIDVETCRLFPRHPGVGYEGVVHELPNQSLQRAGISLHTADIVIHHAGHLLAPERATTKNTRYGNLLRKKLRVQPDDALARYEMAVQLVSEGQTQLAQRLLERTVAEMPEHHATQRARLLLGRLLLADDALEAGLCQLERAVRDWPRVRAGWVDTARAHARLGHLTEASRYLGQAQKLFPRDPVLLRLAAEVDRDLAEIM